MINKKTGFTLVELMLAMAFLGILLLSFAQITIQIGKTYQRGITTKTVNQVGREVMDNLRRDIAGAKADNIKFETTSSTPDDPEKTFRMCLGSVSYLGTTGPLLQNDSSGAILRYVAPSPDAGEPIRLARVKDAGGDYCKRTAGVFDKPTVNEAAEDYRELFKSSSVSNMAVYSIDLSEYADSQVMYSLTVRVGTNDAGSISSETGLCKPITNPDSTGEYCSISEFNTIIRAGYNEVE